MKVLKIRKCILQFIRQLNKKIAQQEYKLVITGGYAIRLHKVIIKQAM